MGCIPLKNQEENESVLMKDVKKYSSETKDGAGIESMKTNDDGDAESWYIKDEKDEDFTRMRDLAQEELRCIED